ncbi:NAD(P)H-dependent flavin oxidoreductase [Paramaledivibacter caminithermalis]|jgi:NAD(P)H-dependent flavin oxidoreductase YrpB (nitropropane dioxygenase family)|uniref:Probable nitronate monooxygenase n=1 Tax=Paramaledivibacter caminithermalis (strain DSM 15212 / CIP 107654 / DViRD3) TaxID=1121301 RepID=A0A1M6S466_PARC5|nr:nitronate monooxygenase [Paramaledivibacter caminithermalis]SHK39602.1 NAD(P)H-dependent flavin oxidoreductase YrpB, nitropropane dioxygenase family [Paramaledivibacter caminithermalis DSM 15212]
MKIPPLKIGDLVAKVPIIQGGMGVGVSLSNLAAAVANEGGIGVISGVQIGFKEKDFKTNNDGANIRGLIKEIRNAKKLSPKGIIGVNMLSAVNNYKDMVKTAVKEKIDLIVSGAGLPKNLPELVMGSDTKIAPIVSSGKAAAVIAKIWDRKYKYVPDVVIVEGPEAGGHLGFSGEQLISLKIPNLKDIVKEVIEVLKPFVEKYKKDIPVIAAGGIYTGKDIAEFLKLGAAGVQMSTRFVATEECDAHINFKKAYISANKEDIQIIKSPVGMPGRAIRNAFAKSIEEGRLKVKKCYNCLKACNPATTLYCISDALINSVQGDVENGLVFVGTNAYRMNEIITVSKLIKELVKEVEDFK